MKHNYHLKINPKEPSREEIERHMDFEALLATYQAEPAAPKARVSHLTTRRWVYRFSAAAAIALLLAIGISYLLNRPQGPTPEEYFAQQPPIAPPLPSLKTTAGLAALTVNVETGGTLEVGNGTELQIPQNAFAAADGTPISGDVTIFYQELHDFVDFFLSGVPLRYDSAAQRYQLESAGMVEIYAEQAGQRVQLLPDHPLEVSFASFVYTDASGSLPQLSIYRYDTAMANWQYLQPDRLSGAAQMTNATFWERRFAELERQARTARSALEAMDPLPQPPLRPERATGDRPTLDLQFTNQLELAEGSNIQPTQLDELNPNGVWEIAPESPPFDQRSATIQWEAVRIVRLAPNRYELTLLKGPDSERLVVRPALLGNAYDQALAAYQDAMAVYQRALDARTARMSAAQDSIDRTLAAQYDELNAEFTAALEASDNPAERREMRRRRVRHTFDIEQLGIYTSAHTLQPPAIQVKAKYQDPSGQTIAVTTAYVTNAEENTVYQFLAADGAPLQLRDGTDNLIWIVTEEGQLAIARSNEGAVAGSKRMTIELQSNQAVGASRESVRRLLSF